MVAVMALMEAPAIIIGVILIQLYNPQKDKIIKIRNVITHSFTNGSVLLILGSLVIGILASENKLRVSSHLPPTFSKAFLQYFF